MCNNVRILCKNIFLSIYKLFGTYCTAQAAVAMHSKQVGY